MRNEEEEQDLEMYKPGTIVGGTWRVVGDQVGEGGYGKVLKVEKLSNPQLVAALKIESTNMQGGSAIKMEVKVLETIHAKGPRQHAPTLFRSSRHHNICYMILSLLGKDIDVLKATFYPDGYDNQVWPKIAIQSLYAIKMVHDAGFVHRDIKAPNFVFGQASDPKKARIVHIIDFGIARQFVYPHPHREGKYVPRAARPRIQFRGTLTYSSPASHDGIELGRKDDLWSLLYMLIDITVKLPWNSCDPGSKIKKWKQKLTDAQLLIRMPSDLLPFPAHLRTLDVYGRPDYLMIYECLLKVFIRNECAWTDDYKWETKAEAARNCEQFNDCEDPEQFLMSDPIQVNFGPSKYLAAQKSPSSFAH